MAFLRHPTARRRCQDVHISNGLLGQGVQIRPGGRARKPSPTATSTAARTSSPAVALGFGMNRGGQTGVALAYTEAACVYSHPSLPGASLSGSLTSLNRFISTAGSRPTLR